MRRAIISILLALGLQGPTAAQDLSAVMIAQDDAAGDETPAPQVAGKAFAPIPAADVQLQDFMWVKRPVVVFADSPNDPQYGRQLEALEAGWPALRERDVVVITDTNPDRATMSDVRRELRPRGFSLIWIDKDGEVRLRKPVVWSARELTHAIDKSPIRRQEMLDERTGR
jgi:hypothetical protein